MLFQARFARMISRWWSSARESSIYFNERLRSTESGVELCKRQNRMKWRLCSKRTNAAQREWAKERDKWETIFCFRSMCCAWEAHGRTPKHTTPKHSTTANTAARKMSAVWILKETNGFGSVFFILLQWHLKSEIDRCRIILVVK